MIARLRSLWQKAKKPLEVFIVTVGCVAVIALVVFIILTYTRNWNVPGLRGKNLWDWLQLLIIPAVLAVGGYLFNYTTSRNEQKTTQLRDQTERDISSDNQREAALQAYIDNMSALLLEKNLRGSGEDDEVRKIARVRTLTVLPRLDGVRKKSVLSFLYESGLIDKGKSIVDLSGAELSGASLGMADLKKADLRGALLSGAYLYRADLHGADLHGAALVSAFLLAADLSAADLSAARLRGAYLSQADLSGADLSRTDLSEADLSEADLSEAKVTTRQLNNAKSLKGTIMPDGTKHD